MQGEVTGDITLVIKLAIGIIAGVAALLLVPRPVLYRVSTGRFNWIVLTLLLASRLGLFAGVFLIAGQSARNDVLAYYDYARVVIEGGLPQGNINPYYAPLFPYLASIPVRVWDSPLSLVLFAIVAELGALLLWLALGRHLFPERTVRSASLLYVTSPIPLLNVAFNGQNQVLLSLGFASSLYLMVRSRESLAGFVQGLGMVMLKFLVLLHVPILLACSRQRRSWLIGFLVPTIAVYGVFALLGVDVFGCLRLHSVHITSGNVIYLLSATGIDLQTRAFITLANLFCAATVGVAFLRALVTQRGCRQDQAVHLLTLVTFTLMLTSHTSPPQYLVTCFFAVCLSIAAMGTRPRDLVIFAGFGILAVLETGLWFRWLRTQGLDLLWRPDLPTMIHRANVWVFLFWEIALLVAYAWYARVGWLALVKTGVETVKPSAGRSDGAPSRPSSCSGLNRGLGKEQKPDRSFSRR